MWFVFCGGLANTLRAWGSQEYADGKLSAIAALWLWGLAAGGGLVFGIGKVIASYFATDDKVDGLVGALMCLQSALEAQSTGDEPPRLRLTIYHPIGSEELEQVIDYVGDDRSGGKAGRKRSARAGVIGSAYLQREAFASHRDNGDYAKYLEELTTQWNFSSEEARQLSPETMSACAIPLQESKESRLIGILFMDAVTPNFFTENQLLTAMAASSAIVKYAIRRYRLDEV